MEISIKDIEKSIKNALGEADVLNTESVYESIDGSNDLKLVIFINKLFNKSNSILYTKLIFVVGDSKKYLVNNSFLYLYDINCNYSNIDFVDTTDFEKKLKNIIKNEKFGPDIKVLSAFIESPAVLINEWFNKNNINELSITNVRYNPKMYIMPCKSLFFSFVISVNNIDIEFNLKKEGKDNYDFNFKINDQNLSVQKTTLKSLVETIGDVLKNNLK